MPHPLFCITIEYNGGKNMTDFSNSDINQIQSHGLTLDETRRQIQCFVDGFPYADIIAPATIGDGIIAMSDATRHRYIAKYDEYRKTNPRTVKFVPASGAATRMFKDLYEFLETGTRNAATDTVLNNLTKFAFYDELQKYLMPDATDRDIISAIVGTPGLNYGKLPKALITFHKYESDTATALAEHLAEAATYATTNGTAHIHFTISPEHRTGFTELLSKIVPEYTTRFGIKYEITMSEQSPTTDTIAVTPDNTPFRNGDGTLLFRPSGHGALIDNLNKLDTDIAFIKNIDNVCTAKNRAKTTEYKCALAGLAIELQEKSFEYIRAIDAGTADIDDIREFIERDLCVRTNDALTFDAARQILNRPIRVCGMVKNTGAPGGGPFWTRGARGTSLQIVESAQIAPDARDIMARASHFNPVDLVCTLRNYRGEKFDLLEFVDPSTGFISEKSSNGRPLRAMERPGLWNGAMAYWNTVFVETPVDTFTPVKTVIDLLNTAHTGK